MSLDWKGNGENVESYESGSITKEANATVQTEVRVGKYTVLKNVLNDVKYKKDATTGYTTKSATLTKKEGGVGVLTITKRKSREHTSETDLAEVDETIYEIAMAQLERPIEMFDDWEQYAKQIVAWKNAVNKDESQYFDAMGEPHDVESTWSDAVNLMLKGVQSYLVFAPVCRRTTKYTEGKLPSSAKMSACGKKETPPSKCTDLIAGNWQWLKTAATATVTATGTTLVEEWTGSYKWEDKIYGTSSNSN